MTSSTLDYVKLRGTCVGCKKKDPMKGLIGKGELYWLKEVHHTAHHVYVDFLRSN
jgi:hypothetical protein